jgi:hypothetical protein
MFIPAAVSVVPNGTHTFTKTFKAPTTPGIYAFKWRMLLNGTGTFGAESPTVMINVT